MDDHDDDIQPAREPEREREGKYAAKDGEDARSHAFLGIENARGGNAMGQISKDVQFVTKCHLRIVMR